MGYLPKHQLLELRPLLQRLDLPLLTGVDEYDQVDGLGEEARLADTELECLLLLVTHEQIHVPGYLNLFLLLLFEIPETDDMPHNLKDIALLLKRLLECPSDRNSD